MLGHIHFPYKSGILVPIRSPHTGHPQSLHTSALELSDPLWDRSSKGRDKGHQKMGFSPLPGLCSSVVWREGTQDSEPGRQGPHLCCCHGLAARQMDLSEPFHSEDRDFQVLLCLFRDIACEK